MGVGVRVGGGASTASSSRGWCSQSRGQGWDPCDQLGVLHIVRGRVRSEEGLGLGAGLNIESWAFSWVGCDI